MNRHIVASLDHTHLSCRASVAGSAVRTARSSGQELGYVYAFSFTNGSWRSYRQLSFAYTKTDQARKGEQRSERSSGL